MGFADVNRSPILKPLYGAVEGVGASKVAIVKIPVGATYLDLALDCKIAGSAASRANIETMLTQWRLTVSGVEKFTLTGKQLLAILEFHRTGLVADTGIVTINFQRLWMDGAAAKFNPAYGTLGESSFQLEITQDATSTIDTIDAFARIAPVAETLGAHMRFARLTPTFSGTGKSYFMDLPRLPNEVLYALHLEYGTPAYLTNIAYIADEVRLVDITPTRLARSYVESNPAKTPQTAKGFVHLDFTCRNEDGDGVPLVMGQQILELDHSTAPNAVTIIAEIGTAAPTQAGVAK